MPDHLNEGKLKDGKKHGKWTRYHKDGSRAVVCHMNDIYTGEISAYWPDGTLKQTGQFNTYAGKWSDGKKTGHWTYYAEDGETVWRVITYKNGSRTKEDDMPLGSCPQCNHYVQSPEWEICPKCGTELIKHLR